MQLLTLTGTNAGTQPIYLPYDKAPVPFGDPLAASLTAATPSIVTVPGYVPTAGDAVSLTIEGPSGFLTTQGVATTAALQLSTTYYVAGINAANGFTLSTSKATLSSLASWSTFGQAGGIPIIHLLSNQVDGTTLPFKPGNTVLAMNGGLPGGVQILTTEGYPSVTLMGAADKTTVYGNPIGPGAYSVIATIAFGTPQLIQLNYDWIVATGSTSSLVLLQN